MIIFVSADSEAFVVLDGELVAVVEGFAEFVFFELLFVVGRDHCEADFGYAVLEEFELVGVIQNWAMERMSVSARMTLSTITS